MSKQITSASLKETAEVAENFLDAIFNLKNAGKKALVVGLIGDLGAGKTTFVQSVGKHLGIKNKMISPTFVIMKKYPIKKGKYKDKYKYFFHLDAYRLKNEKELLYLGWEEIVGNPEHLVFIEWPENVAGIMPKNTKFVKISHQKGQARKFKML